MYVCSILQHRDNNYELQLLVWTHADVILPSSSGSKVMAVLSRPLPKLTR